MDRADDTRPGIVLFQAVVGAGLAEPQFTGLRRSGCDSLCDRNPKRGADGGHGTRSTRRREDAESASDKLDKSLKN